MLTEEDIYEQKTEPIEPPMGQFGRPRFKIGERVRVVFTVMAPAWLKETEGAIGTVTVVVFCRSDGKTTPYTVSGSIRQ